MSWTIACFCGNIYTAPPDRCAVCGNTIEDAAPRPNASATDAAALVTRGAAMPIVGNARHAPRLKRLPRRPPRRGPAGP
jgi:hypothetical protein